LTETVTQGTGNEPSEDTEKLKSNNKKVLWFLSIF
jgi:DNA helicase INO80